MKTIFTILAIAAFSLSAILAQTPTPSPTPPAATALPTPAYRPMLAPQVFTTPAAAMTFIQAVNAAGNTVLVSGSVTKVFPPYGSLITTGSQAGQIRVVLIPSAP